MSRSTPGEKARIANHAVREACSIVNSAPRHRSSSGSVPSGCARRLNALLELRLCQFRFPAPGRHGQSVLRRPAHGRSMRMIWHSCPALSAARCGGVNERALAVRAGLVVLRPRYLLRMVPEVGSASGIVRLPLAIATEHKTRCNLTLRSSRHLPAGRTGRHLLSCPVRPAGSCGSPLR
jgi:hypothetical protein